LYSAFKRNLLVVSPNARIVSPAFPQVFGSVILAMRKGGIETAANVMTNFASGMRKLPKSVVPSPSLFQQTRSS
jgi:hypothetical protein